MLQELYISHLGLIKYIYYMVSELQNASSWPYKTAAVAEEERVAFSSSSQLHVPKTSHKYVCKVS